MKTQNIRVKLRDGEMGAYLAIPDRTPAGAIVAIMEIWGVNDTMRAHAHEFAHADIFGFIRPPSTLRAARYRELHCPCGSRDRPSRVRWSCDP